MLAGQIAVADIGIIEGQTGLLLGAQLFHHIIFTTDLVDHPDTGELAEQRRQHCCFIPVSGNVLGNHTHLHTRIRLAGIRKPGQFGTLRSSRQ